MDGFVLGESMSSSEAAERLERLFKRPSLVGRHVELSE